MPSQHLWSLQTIGHLSAWKCTVCGFIIENPTPDMECHAHDRDLKGREPASAIRQHDWQTSFGHAELWECTICGETTANSASDKECPGANKGCDSLPEDVPSGISECGHSLGEITSLAFAISNQTAPASGVWRHYKGNRYLVLGLGRHTETEEELVIYVPMHDEGKGAAIQCRPLAMWYEIVEWEGAQVPRFVWQGPRR